MNPSLHTECDYEMALLRHQNERLENVLIRLLFVPGDHMSACERIMGATHPCTCGADEARKLIGDPCA